MTSASLEASYLGATTEPSGTNHTGTMTNYKVQVTNHNVPVTNHNVAVTNHNVAVTNYKVSQYHTLMTVLRSGLSPSHDLQPQSTSPRVESPTSEFPRVVSGVSESGPKIEMVLVLK